MAQQLIRVQIYSLVERTIYLRNKTVFTITSTWPTSEACQIIVENVLL